MMKNMYEKEYSEMLEIFYGISVSRIRSLSGEVLGITPEPFSMLRLPVPAGTTACTLQYCLDEYCKKERLEGENAYKVEKTGELISADRDFTFWNLPSVLIIHLKRFSHSMGRSGKTARLVSVPVHELDMTPYVSGYKKIQYKYELYGVCNHGGGTGGGHYHAHVKTPNGWHNFDDTNVSPLGASPPIGNTAYCLFYRKKK